MERLSVEKIKILVSFADISETAESNITLREKLIVRNFTLYKYMELYQKTCCLILLISSKYTDSLLAKTRENLYFNIFSISKVL